MENKQPRKKRKLGSYPFVSVVFSITLALLVLGLFGWMLLHSTKLGRNIQENIEIQVYLNKNLSQSDIDKIQTTIASKPFTLTKENVPQISFESKEDAAKEFMASTGEDFKDFLGDNPLRDMVAVKIASGYQTTEKLTQIKVALEKMRGVFEVEFQKSLVESINSNLLKIGLVLIGIAVFALLVVVILINNTIKLALFSQRFLIRSMQLVGATGWFIQRPFLYRSALYGFVAGIIACLVLHGFTLYMNSIIQGLADLQDAISFGILYISVPILGAVIGYVSSMIAVRKYLKLSLDELY